MRARRLSLAILLIVTVGGIVWVATNQPKAQTIKLPDDSRLTLVAVTRGTKHTYRYGHGWRDFLNPILPLKLRMKLSARVMEWSSFNGDRAMVWLRRDGLPASGFGAERIHLLAADERGLESPLQLYANTTRTTGTGTAKTQFSGWELAGYPKRSTQFRIVVLRSADGTLSPVGEFHVFNPAQPQFPVWTAESFPATRRTNGLEVTLTKLETGLTGRQLETARVNMASRAFSRATFQLRENGAVTESWSVTRIRFSSATGETRYGDRADSRWLNGEHTVDIWGGLWLEEPAWKLDVDFARTADFPTEDLWRIKGVRMPQRGERVENRVQTNLHAATLEFLDITGLKAEFPADQVMPAYVLVHIRAPYPLDRLRVVLADVRDDRGRIARSQDSTSAVGTGAGGNTPKETVTAFRVAIPQGAKSLDITLAATPIRHVEFLAKPVMFGSRTRTVD